MPNRKLTKEEKAFIKNVQDRYNLLANRFTLNELSMDTDGIDLYGRDLLTGSLRELNMIYENIRTLYGAESVKDALDVRFEKRALNIPGLYGEEESGVTEE